MKKFFKENRIFILLLVATALLTWYKILSRYPTGEGFFYFSPQNNVNFNSLTLHSIFSDYGFFAKLIFTIFILIFKDKISFYMYFQFVLMLATYIVFYFVLLNIFRDKWQAFISTVFLIANYVGQYTMMGQGDYQRFIQRVPELIPLFLAILFLVYFLRSGKIKNIVISFSFYTIALIGLHFTSFFLPIFVLLPIVFCFVYRDINIKKLLPIVFFIGITLLVLRSDSLSRPNYSMLSFALNTPHLFQLVTYQVSMTGFPVQFTKFLAEHARNPVVYPYIGIMTPILVIILGYFSLSFLVIRKNKEAVSFYLTLIISLFVFSFLNMYAYNAVTSPLTDFGQDRIYFVHSILFAIIWGIIVSGFFSNLKKNKYRKICIIISILFLFQNIPQIWNEMDNIAVHSEVIKRYLQTVKSLSPEFNKNTILVSPWEALTSSAVISDFYNIPPSNIITFEKNWESKVSGISHDRNNVFIIDFDYSMNSSGIYDANTVKIINLTENYRRKEKIPNSKHE